MNPRTVDLQSVFSSTLGGITQFTGFLISILLLPLAAVQRAFRWLFTQGRIDDLHISYHRTRSHMAEEARSSVHFLRTYLREHRRLVDEFRNGEYGSPQEAQVAYMLFKAAEADLLARAQQAASILSGTHLRP